MSTNLENRVRGRQRKRESRRQASEAQREKKKETFLGGRTKWEMLAAINARWKWPAVKKVNENTYNISSKKHVTKKFLEVSRCSRAKQRQRNVQKSVLHVQSCFIANKTYCCFHRSPASPSLLRITRLYVLFEQTLNILGSFAFSPG